MRNCCMRFAFCSLTILGALVAGPLSAAELSAEQLEFFEAKVRPILVERCYECHSAKKAEPAGGLRVDSHAALLAGGDTGPAIVPGNAKESLFIDAINYGDIYQMPPKSKMPADEIAVLTKWVEQGAFWPDEKDTPAASNTAKAFDIQKLKSQHWCWQPIVNPPLPEVRNKAWPQQDLDRFILARLEKENLSPAPPADRQTLVRRAYFDLIGLPPTLDEMSAALADSSPQWFEHVVDRLLDSPHFGERWGRHWLDLMRYAESRGHEFDYNVPNAYHYRDYVIRALNADLPYDQFVTEHIAGDLLEKPRLHPTEKFNESILGTGFWFFGEWVHSPVDIRKDETDRFDNMIDVFGKSFLGVTISCARCHDHKFDAISQKDYYALFGFLQSSCYRLARFDTMEEEKAIAQRAAELKTASLKPIAAAVAKSKEAVAGRLVDYLMASRELTQQGVVVKPDASGQVTRDSLDDAGRAKILAIAEERKLDPVLLTRWLGELHLASSRKPHPLHAWAAICQSAEATDPQKLSDLLTKAYPPAAKPNEDATTELQVIVDYDKLPPEHWIVDGVGFGLAPVRTGELKLDFSVDNPLLTVADTGSASRDPLWKHLTNAPNAEQEGGAFNRVRRSGQSIRTPTFELKNGKVHALVDGHGFIYAAVDSHVLIHGPLHGKLLTDTGKGTLASVRWVTMDLSDYKGHRLHLEFSPQHESDFRVLKVVEGERPPPEAPAPLPPLVDGDKANGLSVEAVAAAYQRNAQQALALVADNALVGRDDAPAVSYLAKWMLEHPALFEGSDDTSKQARVEADRLVNEYRVKWQELKASIRPASRLAMAMWDGDGEDERLLIRGNTKTVGPVVPRRMLEAIETGPMNLGSGSGRLELARTLVDERNPLTARVMVNRVWHHLFGRGIVPSVDNFGVLGQEPTHPELLDHLATRFRTEGWSIKRLIRSIVLSSSYQMDSRTGDAALADKSQVAVVTDAGESAEARDPQNLLFHRQNLKRLEGEVIRDSILAVSGRLDRTMYGPSVPIHLTPFMQGRGRPGESGPVDGRGRRSIYLSIRRNFLNPMMLAFDTPIPSTSVGSRNVSNVPAQALILMNDPLVMEQSRVWARRLLAEKDLSTEARVGRMYEQAFSRPARPDEIAAAVAFLETQGREHGLSAEQSQTDERVWADLCHVMYNVKEFVFVR